MNITESEYHYPAPVVVGSTVNTSVRHHGDHDHVKHVTKNHVWQPPPHMHQYVKRIPVTQYHTIEVPVESHELVTEMHEVEQKVPIVTSVPHVTYETKKVQIPVQKLVPVTKMETRTIPSTTY